MLDRDGLTHEVSIGVTYASLMSAVALFFAGVLISQFSAFDASIKVPLVFLIISTFSFIFSATIYSNAATELTLGRFNNVQRYMVYAKNIGELLGLYLFILAVPMVLGAVTHDGFLRVLTIAIALGGFGLYSQSKFSILDSELTRSGKRWLSLVIVVLAAQLYYFQGSHVDWAVEIYGATAIVLLAIFLVMTYAFCTAGKQYNAVMLRKYDGDDVQGISSLMQSNIKLIKRSVLPEPALDELKQAAQPAAIRQLAESKSITVAEFKGRIAGVAVLYGNEISHVYADPKLHRKGIGRQMVEYLEDEARNDGFKSTVHVANAVDKKFFVKIGYKADKVSEKKGATHYHMKKKLR